ncbi:AraC family transcriptional regulator [Rhodococcus chondri]|uniref:AraC family transcriptional regulator n=1 Tax=Rhodococcus chondri TaxID=3065941 RepID=A0ABU7JRY8_9NOCA|nr:AraC family transcriptional regulator [Rhodococcus sp. CC-R104]MEE2032795.1 AraC family transcriptional regulator [Rhodococcus sp. CC-R104]
MTGATPAPSGWAEAAEVVSHAYFMHDLKPLRNTAPSLNLRTLPLGSVRLARIGWGAEVAIDSTHPGAYAVNIPLSGCIESVAAGIEVVSGVGQASVFRPDTAATISRWTDDCEIVGVKLERDYLHREMARILGRPDMQLPAQVDLTTESGRSWMTLLRSIVEQLKADESLWNNPLVAEQLSGALTSSFILAVMPDDADPAAGARPRIIKRVLDRLHADPSQPWTTAEMAALAGVSARRLQEGFREYLGVCPRDYLLNLRLERIHEALAGGNAAELSVTDVALSWGITHTGRFAAAYRRKYGVAPSETLRG